MKEAKAAEFQGRYVWSPVSPKSKSAMEVSRLYWIENGEFPEHTYIRVRVHVEEL